MEAGGTTLPHLGPVLEERKNRAGGSRSTSSQPYSARLSRDDRSNYLAREEEAVRAVYKKHAQSFFEEVKDGFLKEAAALRKQAQKAFAKAGVAWDAADTAGNSEALEPNAGAEGSTPSTLAALQAQMLALQRQVGDMHVTLSTRHSRPLGSPAESESSKAGRSPSPPCTSPGPGGTGSGERVVGALSEKLARQQDEIKALSRLVKSEFGAAKKAALTPMWKERALQEIAQGELRAVCADEVGKAFRDFAAAFSEREAEAAVNRLCESGETPMESRLRAELDLVRNKFARQSAELSSRADEGTAARAVIIDRIGALEDRQEAQSSEVVQVEETLRSMHQEGVGGIHKKIDMLNERFGSTLTKIDSVEAKCTALHASLSSALQASKAEEASQRQSSIAKVTADVDALRMRTEDEHKRLEGQISIATASSAETCTRAVAEVEKRMEQFVKDEVRGGDDAVCADFVARMKSQQDAVDLQRLLTTERLRKDLDALRSEFQASHEEAAKRAEVVAAQGENGIKQHSTRLNDVEARLDAVQRRADGLHSGLAVCNKEIDACRQADKKIADELSSVVQRNKDDFDRGILPLSEALQARIVRLEAQQSQLNLLGERVEEMTRTSSVPPHDFAARRIPSGAAAQALAQRSTQHTQSASSHGCLVELEEMFNRGTFDFEDAHQNREDTPDVVSIADDVTAQMIEQSWLSEYTLDLRVPPGGRMDILGDASEESREPSVASMTRSSPDSACGPSWQLFKSEASR